MATGYNISDNSDRISRELLARQQQSMGCIMHPAKLKSRLQPDMVTYYRACYGLLYYGGARYQSEQFSTVIVRYFGKK